jgi:hypothetical protein
MNMKMVMLLAVCVALVAATGTGTHSKKKTGGVDTEFGRAVRNIVGQAVLKVAGNQYNVDFYPNANTTYIAGQEIRMRVSTIYFSMEHYRYGTSFVRGDRHLAHRPHNNEIKLAKLWKLHRKVRGGQGPQSRWYNVSGLNESYFPAFNVSGPSSVRVRVVAAYGSRTTMAGEAIGCAAATDVWSEFWSMSGQSLAWGRELAFSAFVTFNVPPFAWKVCIKDVTTRNATKNGRQFDSSLNALWQEFHNFAGAKIFNEPIYLWYAPSTLYVDDYAAIRVVANGRAERWQGKNFDSYDFSMSAASLTYRGDFVKLVPAGFPCTYEKATASAEYRHSWSHAAMTALQYCGSNAIKAASGDFAIAQCVNEGSIAEGVFRTGSNQKNPFSSVQTVTSGETVPSGQNLVAYGKLPAAGNYDLCFSPRAYRLSLLNVTLTTRSGWSDMYFGTAIPVWFKLFKSEGTCPSSNSWGTISGCSPRTMMLTTSPPPTRSPSPPST